MLVLIGPSCAVYGNEGVGVCGNTAAVASGVRSDGVDVPTLFLADTLATAFYPALHLSLSIEKKELIGTKQFIAVPSQLTAVHNYSLVLIISTMY